MHSRAMCVGFLILPMTVLMGCVAGAPQPTDARDPTPTTPSPPVAEARPFTVLSPNGNRMDEYYWLRDDTRTDKAVLGYLEAENAYLAAMTAHTRALADRVYEETVARIQQDDATVPYRKRSYWYYTRYEAGSEHPIYARKAGTLEAAEQVMLDASELARGHGYYAVGEYAIAPNDRLLAYVDDTVGRRQYTLRFKDLATGKTLPDAIPNVEPYLAWNADSTSVLYVEKNPVTLLGYRVRRHVLGTDPARDPLVYEQDDLSFYTSVTTTKDGRFLLIVAESTEASEVRYADAADPALKFRVFLPRERGHEYQVEHLDGRWIIRSNWQAPNFRLLEANVGAGGRSRPLARAGGAPRRRLHPRLRRVSRLPRDRGAFRGAAQDPDPALGRWQGLLHHLRRVGLHDLPRAERGDRLPRRPIRVHIARDPVLDV